MTTPNAALKSSQLSEVLTYLRAVRGPDERGEYVCWCPFHPDGQGKPPHHANLQVSERGFYCHACGAGGSLGQLAEHLGIAAVTGGSSPESTYDYRDETGTLLYQVCRYPRKRFLQRRPDGDGGWAWNLRGVPRVLYRLPELQADREATVCIVEGEKDADRLAREGLVATTNSGGAGKWRREYTDLLRGREVAIIPDNDEPGRRHAHGVAHSLQSRARSVKVLELPELPEKGDVSDWFAAGHTTAELQALLEAAPAWQPLAADRDEQPQKMRDSRKKESQADRLVTLLETEGVQLFHDDLSDSFARVPIRNHREVWRCRSKDFRRWLARGFWKSEEKAIGCDALSSALNVVESWARFDGDEHTLHNRVARHDGAIWYDLADEGWRAVRITGKAWSVVADPPILFRRYSHQRSQLEPAGGGDLRDLLRFVNLGDPSQGLLLLVYVVCCFVPDIPHPIPVLHGPQGSAKTTLFRMLRRLVDPSAVEVLSFPHSETELVQQLSHHWAPYYDNISTLSSSVSDILCRAVTGEGFSKRELYSDDEDFIYTFRRCVGMNGVNVVVHKPDLLDRCMLFGLELIDPAQRKPEEVIWREFEEARPRLLGGVFDVLSRAMTLRGSVDLAALPRMADFALWGCAIARALGHSEEEFLAAYEGNTDARNEEALQASPVAAMVVELMEQRTEWEGTPTDLLVELKELAEQRRVNTKAKGWPQAAHALSRRLNEVRPNLAAVGIGITMRRSGRHRVVVILKAPTSGVTSAASDRSTEGTHDHAGVLHGAAAEASRGPSPTASPGEPLGEAPIAGSDASDADDAFFGPS